MRLKFAYSFMRSMSDRHWYVALKELANSDAAARGYDRGHLGS